MGTGTQSQKNTNKEKDMKNMKKIMSLFLALVMLVGVALPSVAMAAGEDEQGTKKVYVHKMLMSKENLGNTKFPGTEGLDKTKYDGNQIQDLGAFFGTGSTEIPGVYFVVEKEFDVPDTSQGAAAGATKKEWKAVTKTGTQAKDDLTDALAGLTKETTVGQNKFTALELDTSKLPKGTYRINEVHDKSTYVGKKGETLADMKAVPTVITLPLVNEKGVVTEAHVYPKNTEDKPDTHKDFTKEFKQAQPNGRDDTTKANADPEPHNVGDVIDYTVTTKVPAKTKWKTAFWDDVMTEGLTFITKTAATGDLAGKGITVKYNNADMDTSWYTLSETENGFTLTLTDAGLEGIKDKDEATIRLDYHAVLNEKAVVKIPESNDVTFHYGNNKNHGNTPVPNKPNDNGEMNVTKTWADGVPAAGEWAEFTLYNAQTGKKVGTVKFETTASGTTTTYTANADYVATGNEKPQGPSQKTDGTANDKTTWKFTWTGLDKDIEYKVVEKNNMNETATYGKGANGEITITNNKWNNPEPINPNEPKVVTYGAKFVKTDTEGKRLPGAEFVVKNSENKFLTGTAVNRTEYEAAQTAFVTAVKAYNEAIKDGKVIGTGQNDATVTIGGVSYNDDAKAKEAIKALETRRDMLWSATLKDMNGFTATKKDDTNVLKLTSNELGQFEIAGLKPGTYTLVEVKAPDTYVDATKATLEFSFTIKNDGTQEPKNFDFGVTDKDTTNDNAQQIINKKVDIPQTGGIGTVIFTVVGISLMAGAFIAMRKRTAEEN